MYVSVYGCICFLYNVILFMVGKNFCRNMFLQPRLKDFNSKSRSTSPFPFISQAHGHSGLIGQDASSMSRPVEGVNIFDNQTELGSSRACLTTSAGNSIGSWDMSMVSMCCICDVMLRHGLQAESSADSGRLSSQNFSEDPAVPRYLSHGISVRDTSDGSLSSRFSSRGSLLLDKELYESQLYAKELEQKITRLETQCTTLQYVLSILLTCCVSLGTDRHIIRF